MDEHTKVVEHDSSQETSLTRRKVLGVGALAAGGAVVGGLVKASSADAATVISGTTALKAAAAKSATSITVRSTAGFAAGYTIWLDLGGKVESAVVKSVTPSTFKLTLKAPLGQAHSAGARVSVIPPVDFVPGPFKTALKKIVNDATYGAAAAASPHMITDDYPTISPMELDALRECAILSGVDVGAINAARAAAITSSAPDDTGFVNGGSGVVVVAGWTVSCCCCCCCKL